MEGRLLISKKKFYKYPPKEFNYPNFFTIKKIMSTMITLSCLIQCDNPNRKNIFKIEIENDESISKLKEEIRKKKYNNFVNVNTDELQLWKVNIPLDKPNNRLNILNTRPCASIKEELEGEEMGTTKNVGEYFSN